MNLKKSLIILFFLAVLVCAASSVSAADDAGDIAASDESGDVIAMEDSDALEATPSEDIIANATGSETSNSSGDAPKTATLKTSAVTVAYKKNGVWSISLTDENNKGIADKNIILKIFTGYKYNTVNVKTDSNGMANYNTKSLSLGNHQIEASLNDVNYTASSILSSVKVIKQIPLKITVYVRTAKDGSSISIYVKNKKTKKYVNGVKLKVLVYTGKTYKTINLKTKKVHGVKGFAGYATNELSVGKHKVKIIPADIKYGGSKTTKMTIKKSARKYPKWTSRV